MPRPETEHKALLGSGFEKKGGYASPKTPVASLPKVPSGPAPGASPTASASSGKTSGSGQQSQGK